ncbi:MAG: penicillin-binding protein 2 [Parcubacteria group bacterium]|jgi:penicillin-binding protein 2
MFGSKRNRTKLSKGIELEDYLFSVSKEESARIEIPLEKNKMGIFWAVILVFMVILGSRIFYLNIVKETYYKEIAKENSIRSVSVKAPRGKIMDRFGNALVNNIPSVDATAIPANLPEDSDGLKKLSVELSRILSISEEDLLAKVISVESSSLSPILIKENISQEEHLSLEEKKSDFPGIFTDKTAIREYVDSSIFSHILGYVGKIDKKELADNSDYFLTDYMGKQGVEKTYEKYLKGKNGAVKVEVDSLGNVKKERGIINPEAGNDLVLGIDYELQKKIYDELSKVLETTDTRTAAAVAIDPKNGEVRAMVSLPSFDNNIFSGRISQEDYSKLISDPAKPLFNRAISGEYPPGSTIKPLIASAALSEGVIAPSTIINGLGGSLNIGNFHFGDWKVHGPSDVRMAIAESNDIFFYTIGGGYGNIQGLGMDRMKKYENLFGWGDILGIDIPGESSGFVPDTQWKLDKLGERWYTGDDYHCAIGQGFIRATPLQIANYIAAIANGGTLYQPRVVSKIINNNDETINNSAVVIRDKFISPEILKVVQEGMRETVVSGTAQTLKDLPVESAGKTGTAQFGSEDKTHAWFASYAPYNNPELAMIVLVEGGGEGHSSALPVTNEVYKWYFGERNKQKN